MINALYNHWFTGGQKLVLLQSMTADQAQGLVKFLGFVHDIGKATPSFQTKPSYGNDFSIDSVLIEKLISAGFTRLNEMNLSSPNASPHAKAGEALLLNFGVPDSIAAIVGGHHGKPLDDSPKDDIENYTGNYWQTDSNSSLQRPWKQVQKELFSYGLAEAGFSTAQDIPTVNKPQAILLEGLLIMGDWLASSENLEGNQEQPLFPLVPVTESLGAIESEDRFHKAWQEWYINEGWTPENVGPIEDAYQDRWGFSPRPVQRTVTEAITQSTDLGMMIVEAPMGVGKTELALMSAEQLAYQSQRKGLFFALPTQATTNAMFDRVNKWLGYLVKKQQETLTIKLLHGKARFNQRYAQLPEAENVDNVDQPDEIATVAVNSWFSGKKSILEDFSVGTIDHLLLLALKQKHLALRHLGLSEKVVIIDEVHAYDAYMNEYLYRALEWLGAYHVPVILLSATLPKQKRNRLLEVYFRGKYGEKLTDGVDECQVSSNWRNSEDYPLVSMLDGKALKQITAFPGVTDQLPLRIQVERTSKSDEEIVQTIVHSIRDGGVVGVIVNTVKRAQKLAQLIPSDIKVEVFHSSFLVPDRAKREEKLQQQIGGKTRDRPHQLIVIGTQVLEQSLDIDFDVLYTDVAPMDLLLQRAGRLHRHDQQRPASFKQPRLVVMGIRGPGDYDDGSVAVYGQYLLMKTDHDLPPMIQLPDDISTLVQQVYDVSRDPDMEGIEGAKAKFDELVTREKQKAKTFQIEMPKINKIQTLHGWLKRNQAQVDTSEQRANAAVRDIKETLEVILLQHTDKGDFLIDGRKLEDCSDKAIAEQVIRLPNSVSEPISPTIRALEIVTSKHYPAWQDSKWLKGSLAVTLDENLQGSVGHWQLEYSPSSGLSYRKEEKDGKADI